MKILYISGSFPEPNKGSTIYTDLAEALNEAGHEITVAVYEQSINKKKTEMKKERGFDVLRIVTGNYFNVGLIEKGITSLMIPVLMRAGINKYFNNYQIDLILFEAPPVTNARLITWAKKKFSCKTYLMLKDIFPQNAVDLGIMNKNGLIYKYFKGMEEKLYKTSDTIGCMSLANKKYLIEHNTCLIEKVELFPNTKKLNNSFKSNGYKLRKHYSIPNEACVFVFGGNMGKPQHIDLLCTAIKRCKNEKNIFFLFIGSGTDRFKLEQTISKNQIMNAIVVESLPRNDYEQIIKECDIGLIVLDPRFTIPNFPSRILTFMEYAKPVLAATDKSTDIKDIIEDAQCGEWVWSGDIDAFIAKIKGMAGSNDLSTKGNNGRKYIEENFNVNLSVEIIEKHFKQLSEVV
ncbi:MAG: glycosyltransferase family 4 protein [Tissierellia bacterium]|nr:glycosyltransferase family 4 protein [Tissierellia bacterium]